MNAPRGSKQQGPTRKSSVTSSHNLQELEGSLNGSHLAGRDRPSWLRRLAGNKPMFIPYTVPLNLLFFRRIFSKLHRRYGDSEGEVPVSVFQRTVVRLFRVLGMNTEFDAESYDADNSGAVGWQEFVSCWRVSKVAIVLGWPERVFLAMEDPTACFIGQVVNIIISLLIFISCTCFIFGTLPEVKVIPCPDCEPELPAVFSVLEGLCVGVFTLEYLVRACTAPFARSELLDYGRVLEYVAGNEAASVIPSAAMRLFRFGTEPMNVVDLFVVLPYFLELALLHMDVSHLTVLRVLRLTRIFRLVKFGKQFDIMEIVTRVIHKSHLMLYVMLVYLFLGLCFSSATVYYIEGGTWDVDEQTYIRTSHDGTRDESPFLSIPHAMWFCMVTLTTVGYGESQNVPVTTMGKIVTACIMMCGIIVLAMPISVISTCFNEVWSDWNEERRLEAESFHDDYMRVTEVLEGLNSMTRLVIEVFDERAGREAPESLGKVELTDVPVQSLDTEASSGIYPLEGKKDHDHTKVSGSLSVGYVWRPLGATACSDEEEAPRIRGNLEVKVQRAQGLPRNEWKKRGQRDAFAVVQCWPRPLQPGNGKDWSRQYRTKTAKLTLDPEWEERVTFEYDWPKDWKPDNKAADKPPMLEDEVWDPVSMAWTGAGAIEKTTEALSKQVEAHSRDIHLLSTQVGEVMDILTELHTSLRDGTFMFDGGDRLDRADTPSVESAPQTTHLKDLYRYPSDLSESAASGFLDKLNDSIPPLPLHELHLSEGGPNVDITTGPSGRRNTVG